MSALAGRMLQALWAPAAPHVPAWLWPPVHHSLLCLTSPAGASAETANSDSFFESSLAHGHELRDALGVSLSEPQPSTVEAIGDGHGRQPMCLPLPLPVRSYSQLDRSRVSIYPFASQLTQLRLYMRGAHGHAAAQRGRRGPASDPHAERRQSGLRASTSAAPRARVEVSHGAIPRVLQLCRDPLPRSDAAMQVADLEQLWPEGNVSSKVKQARTQLSNPPTASRRLQMRSNKPEASNAAVTPPTEEGTRQPQDPITDSRRVVTDADVERALGISLMAARSEAELLALVNSNRNSFTPIHNTQALLRLWRLSGARRGNLGRQQKDGLMAALGHHITENVEDYDCQGLGICAYALARLQAHNQKEALMAIGVRGMALCAELSTQNMVNILWAHGKLRAVSHAVFSAFAEEIMQRLPEVGPQDLSNTAWAFARMGNDHPMLFEKLAETILDQSWSFLPQHISSIAWAYSTLQIECQPLLVELGHQAAAQAEGFSSQGLANLLWSYAVLGFRHREMLHHLSPVISLRARGMQPQELVNSLWAFASLGVDSQHGPEGQALRSLVTVSLQRAQDHELSPQGISNLVWSLAVLGILDSDRMRLMVPSLERCADRFTQEAWVQIYMADLWVAGLREPGPTSPLPPNLLQKAADAWALRTIPQRAESHGQPILDALDSLEIGVDSIGVNPGADISADIVISLDGHQVGLLIGTGLHFPSNDASGSPRGQFFLRQRLLEQKGLAVACLPMVEWASIAEDSTAMVQYMRGKLGDVLHSMKSGRSGSGSRS